MWDAQGDDRTPAQELFGQRADVRQRVSVLELGQTAGTNYGVEFCLRSLLDLWMSSHREEERLDGGEGL